MKFLNNKSFLEATRYRNLNQRTDTSTNRTARNLKNIFNGFLQRVNIDSEDQVTSEAQINSILSNVGMTEDNLIDRVKLPSLILKYARYDNAILFNEENGGNPYDAFIFYPTSISNQIDSTTGKSYRENMSSKEDFFERVDRVYPNDRHISSEYESKVAAAQIEFWNMLPNGTTQFEINSKVDLEPDSQKKNELRDKLQKEFNNSNEAIEYLWSKAIFFGRAINLLWNNVFHRELKPIWYLARNLRKSKEVSFNSLDATEKEKVIKEIEKLQRKIKKELEIINTRKIKKEDELDNSDLDLDYDDSDDLDTFGSDTISYKSNEDDEYNKNNKTNPLFETQNQAAIDDFRDFLYFCKSCLGGWARMKVFAPILGVGYAYSLDENGKLVTTLKSDESENNPYDVLSAGKETRVQDSNLLDSLFYRILHAFGGWSKPYFPDYIQNHLLDKAYRYLDEIKHSILTPDTDLVIGFDKTDMQNQSDAFGPEMNIGKNDHQYGLTDEVKEKLIDLFKQVRDYISPEYKTPARIENANKLAYERFKLLCMWFYNVPQVDYNGNPVQFEEKYTKNGIKRVPIRIVTPDSLKQSRQDSNSNVTYKDIQEVLQGSMEKLNPKAKLDPTLEYTRQNYVEAITALKDVVYYNLNTKNSSDYNYIESFLNQYYDIAYGYKTYKDDIKDEEGNIIHKKGDVVLDENGNLIPLNFTDRVKTVNPREIGHRLDDNVEITKKDEKLSSDEEKKQRLIKKQGLYNKYLQKYIYDPTYIQKLKRDENGNLVVDESVPTETKYDIEPLQDKNDNIDNDINDVLDKIDNIDDSDNIDMDEENKKDANDDSTDKE